MKDAIRHYIGHHLLGHPDGAAVGDDDDLLGTGLVDSVGMMSLVLFIEEEFGVPVPPEDVTIEHFFSLRTIDDYLRARRG